MFRQTLQHITATLLLLGTGTAAALYGMTPSSHQAAARAKEVIISKSGAMPQAALKRNHL